MWMKGARVLALHVAVSFFRWGRSLRGYLTKYDCSSGQFEGIPLFVVLMASVDFLSGREPYWRD